MIQIKIDLYYLIYEEIKRQITSLVKDRDVVKIFYKIENDGLGNVFKIRVNYKEKEFIISTRTTWQGNDGRDCRDISTDTFMQNLEKELEKLKNKILEFDRMNEMNLEELREEYFKKNIKI